MADATDLAATIPFRLSVVGLAVTERYAHRIAAIDLKPKHAGLLRVLLTEDGISQQEAAALLGVAPSLMVGLVDHLEGLGALRRDRDPLDRRRQVLAATAEGRRLYDRCRAIARELGDELVADMPAAEVKALESALARLTADLVGIETT